MPVTVKPSPDLVGRNSDPMVHSAEALLKNAAKAWSPDPSCLNPRSREMKKVENRPIIQSSFADLDPAAGLIPYGNGLVNGVIRAFQQDLHLVLRPDDIWLSILTQFSMFVNANAERLRALFVAHEDKKNLTIDISPHPISSIDMGKFAQEMTHLIHDNVVDIELRDWILPKFSTTTDIDKSVAAIVMMGTLQRYFDFRLCGGCGFPSVTLLGEKSDWEEILRKVQILPKYGDETTEWARLLAPIIQNMIASFDRPNSQQVKDFWLRACHSAGRDGSGNGQVETLSGWITAFCFWSETGTRIGPDYGVPLDRKELVLNDIAYPLIRPKSIPKGVISVPVTIQDHQTGLQHETSMIAGSVGMTGTAVGGGKDLTIVQPRSGWWILHDSVKAMA
ncbi:hypothetical protein MMC07_002108 [Pseudocyphellaria aurata]|nr:hypothetical protein [Pseudocyphellaria aurata]